jgi:hypothetical protein
MSSREVSHSGNRENSQEVNASRVGFSASRSVDFMRVSASQERMISRRQDSAYQERMRVLAERSPMGSWRPDLDFQERIRAQRQDPAYQERIRAQRQDPAYQERIRAQRQDERSDRYVDQDINHITQELAGTVLISYTDRICARNEADSARPSDNVVREHVTLMQMFLEVHRIDASVDWDDHSRREQHRLRWNEMSSEDQQRARDLVRDELQQMRRR